MGNIGVWFRTCKYAKMTDVFSVNLETTEDVQVNGRVVKPLSSVQGHDEAPDAGCQIRSNQPEESIHHA
jgi:hypothetical protein